MSEAPPPGDGPSAAIGLSYESFGEGAVRAEVPVSAAVLQPFGIVHGGVYSLIAETICSEATGRAVAADGMVALGMANSATFLRPISEGTIHATATACHKGRTTWVWDTEFTDDAGRVAALVRMTIAVRPRPGG